MAIFVNLALIIISIALIAIVLLQGKGAGLNGGIFGGDSLYGSRRGIEKTVFQVTIVLSVVFVVLNIWAFIVSR